MKTWYKTTFFINSTNIFNEGVILIDIGCCNKGMNRGHFYINGINMGHYNIVGYYQENTNNYYSVQRYYFVPNDLINIQSENVLIFDEDFEQIDVKQVKIVLSNVVVP